MPTVTFTDHNGTQIVVTGRSGDSVMETAVRQGISGIVAECGGVMACATCHVFVEPAGFEALPPMESSENEMLDWTAETRSDLSRLSCQIELDDSTDLRVTTPKVQV